MKKVLLIFLGGFIYPTIVFGALYLLSAGLGNSFDLSILMPSINVSGIILLSFMFLLFYAVSALETRDMM